MIIFKEIEMEGFGIFVNPIKFKLDRPGINILSLSNGRGKSTIFGALVWVLYEKALKEGSTIPSYEHLRTSTWRGTKVSISFIKDNTHYRITRCHEWTSKVHGEKGRNKVFIAINNAPYESLKSKTDLNQYVIDLIGYSYKLFINTVVFPQKTSRFIEEKGVDKRKIFEEVFDLGWITKALELAKESTIKLGQKSYNKTLELNKLTAEVDSLQMFIDKVGESRKDFYSEKLSIINKLRSDLDSLQKDNFKDPTNLEDQIRVLTRELDLLSNSFSQSELDEVSTQYQRVVDQKAGGILKIKDLTEHSEEYSREGESRCPTCNQILPKKTQGTLLNETQFELDNLKEQLKQNDLLGINLYNRIGKLKNQARQIRELGNEINKLNSELRVTYNYNQGIQEYVNKREKIKSQIETEEAREFNDISKEMVEKLKAKQKLESALFLETRGITRTLAKYNWIIKYPLSESGIKSFIINKMISLLNDKLAYYKDFINFDVQLEVDQEKARKDIYTLIYREGNPVLLADLSGGEKQLVNLVVALALTDLLKELSNNSQTNLQIFDEVFESLDPSNVEVVSMLLQSIYTGDQSIFIVTHKKDFILTNSNTIKLWQE